MQVISASIERNNSQSAQNATISSVTTLWRNNSLEYSNMCKNAMAYNSIEYSNIRYLAEYRNYRKVYAITFCYPIF